MDKPFVDINKLGLLLGSHMPQFLEEEDYFQELSTNSRTIHLNIGSRQKPSRFTASTSSDVQR